MTGKVSGKIRTSPPWATAIALCLVCPISAFAAHAPLLPQPKQISYGTGHLEVRGLAIEFASAPSPEDRFAAGELSRWLGERAHTKIPIREGKASGSAIILDRTGAVQALPMPGEKAGPDSRESYSLVVTPTGVTIRARSSAGLFYGAETLRQLVEGNGSQAAVPVVSIHDWPSLAYRGTMIDMSHGPVLTVAEVERQLRFMARWKENQYYFYNEDSIALDGFPWVRPPDGQFTTEQVRTIIAYARRWHIDVVPCLELYGHQEDLLRVERYSKLAFLPYGADFDPRNPQAISLLQDWIDQYAQLFPGPFFHIGFDETGETKQLASAPDQLYLNLFLKVSSMVRSHGKTVMMWSDMLSKYPNLISQVSPGTIVVPWGYDRTVYEPYWKPFANLPIPKSIATGVSVWNQILPDFTTSFDNIDDFLAVGRGANVLGVINTVWTDDVMVLLRPAMPGVAYGAVASWQPEKPDRAHFFSNYAQALYAAPAAPEVAAALQDLAECEDRLASTVGGDTLPELWRDPFTPDMLSRINSHLPDLHQARVSAEDAEVHLSRALDMPGDHAQLPELLAEARLADYAGMKWLYASQINGFWQHLGKHPKHGDLEFYGGEIYYHDHSRIADLLDAIGDIQGAYRAAWLQGYTPYRLRRVMQMFDSEMEYWWATKARLQQIVRDYHSGDTLPPIESFTSLR